jgi:hypothetical protein
MMIIIPRESPSVAEVTIRSSVSLTQLRIASKPTTISWGRVKESEDFLVGNTQEKLLCPSFPFQGDLSSILRKRKGSSPSTSEIGPYLELDLSVVLDVASGFI